MRNTLLKSSALAALLITSSLAYAQSPEPKSDKNAPAAAHEGTAQQEQRRDARPNPKGSARQTAPKEEPSHAQQAPASRNTAQEKTSPATSSQSDNRPKRADEHRKNAAEERKAEERKNAQEQRKSEDARKDAAERKQQDKSKSTAAPASQQQQQQQKAGTQSPAQDQRKGAATQTPAQQQQQGATQTPAQQQQKTTTQAPAQTQQPAAAQSNAPASSTNTTQQTTTQQNTNVTTNANQLPPQKQVQISETFTRTKVASPDRNLRRLNVSINVGTVVPSRVRFYPLPREIWTIEPRYRDYEYFTTEEDIVIVEPRSHRIVSLVPRNPQRARAQVSQVSGSSFGAASAAPPPCQIMKRDQSGQLTEIRPDDLRSTVGSGGQVPALSVMVQAGGGQGTQPIPLDAPGQIVVASRGNGDCQITIEPLQR